MLRMVASFCHWRAGRALAAGKRWLALETAILDWIANQRGCNGKAEEENRGCR